MKLKVTAGSIVNVIAITMAVHAPCLLLSGCAPYSTMHSADTVAKDKSRFKASLIYPTEFLDDEDVTAEFFLYALSAGYRFGLSERADMGIKMGILESLSVDWKYKFIDGPLMLSGDLGLSLLLIDDFTLGVHPMILAGTRHWYIGVKSLNFPSLSGDPLVGFFAGLVVGEQTKVYPEISVYNLVDEDDKLVLLGLGLELPGKKQKFKR